jgi:methionine-rich copper-binding protein CopC
MCRSRAAHGEDRDPPVDSDAVDTLARASRPTGHGHAAQCRRFLPALVAALLLGLVAAGPALGHAELEQSMPEDGEILAAPPTFVTLAFTEGLNAEKSSFLLLRAGGEEIATGSASADGETTMSATDLQLEPGDYVIRWTAVAEDGHVERGRLTFTVEAPTPSPSPTPAPTDASESLLPSPSPSPVATPTATPVPSPSADTTPVASGGTDVLLPIVAALAIVGIVAYLVLRRGRTA